MRFRWRWVGVPLALLLLLPAAGAIFLQADLLAAPAVLLVAATWLAIATVIVVAKIDKRLIRSHQPTSWIGRRFGRGPRGIALTASFLLTIVCAVAIYLLGQRVSIVNSEISRFDLRIVDLAHSQGTVSQRPVMSALTEIGRGRITAIMLVLIALGAIVAGARRAVLLMVAIPVLSSIAVTALKSFHSRPRPIFGGLLEASHSFPSGHSAAGLALATGVLVMARRCGFKRLWLASAILLPLGLSIGYSRAFLSVHWTSDVVGGWLVASATTGLVLTTSLLLPRTAEKWEVKHGWIDAGLGAALTVALVIGFAGARNSFPDFPATKLEKVTDLEAVVEKLPRTSETLLGRQLEPVNLLITSAEIELRNTLLELGYIQVPPLTAKSIIGNYRSPAQRALAVPRAFLDTRVQDFAIQMPAANGRARHYARFWRLPVLLESGCVVWASNATLRDSSDGSGWRVIPESHMGPKVDEEREYLVKGLTGSGSFHFFGLKRVRQTQSDRAAGGDLFTTDGNIALLETLTPCQIER